MRTIYINFLLFLSFSITAQNQERPNIILMIGDGMGLTQITAGMYSLGNSSALEDFPITGLAKTHSYNQLVTDSAASGTAFACGEKTYNGVLGIDPKNRKLESIMEYCQTLGYQSALLVTSSIVHATPASFYANVASRNNYQKIALQLSESKVDYFMGGGRKHFIKRNDKVNLLDAMDKTFSFVNSVEEFQSSTAKRIGFFTDDDEPRSLRLGRTPALKPIVEATLEKLNQKEAPFFMLVEGSQIDWAGHDNDLSFMLSEFKDFNDAIAAALNFAEKDGNTIVIVTADHETGGLTIPGGNLAKQRIKGDYATKGHTASMVPVFAYGPSSETFSGIYDNTSIFKKMKALVE